MNLFTKEAPPKPVTGIDVLHGCRAQDQAERPGRDRARYRRHRHRPAGSLRRRGNLSVELLQALARVLYPHSEYDPELNLVRPANKEPARGFIYPPPVQPGPGAGENRGIKLPEAAQGKPKPKGRPGWIGG